MSNQPFHCVCFEYRGADAEKFLQGQVTLNVNSLDDTHFQATAICDLKGRIHFGIWLRRPEPEYIEIVISADLADEMALHIKKFGAFSKATLSPAQPIGFAIIDNQASFSKIPEQQVSSEAWQTFAIQHGQAWITQSTSHLFQPQELRLHQRGGVHYDKGCYLGQEIIARLWFKAQPKHWLHLIQGQGTCPTASEQLSKDVQVINATAYESGWLALVTAKPERLSEMEITVLALPEALQGNIAREK